MAAAVAKAHPAKPIRLKCTRYGQVLPAGVSKYKVAEAAIEAGPLSLEVLDLKPRLEELVRFIRVANHLQA
jgi:hypothetical protein